MLSLDPGRVAPPPARPGRPTADKVDNLTRRQRAREAAQFAQVRRAEAGYGVSLRKIARTIGELIRGLRPGDASSAAEVESVLRRYADVLLPWARAAAARMLREVARRDERAWFRSARAIGVELRREIQAAPVGAEMRRLQEEQVRLITSLPLEAARRVQELTREYVAGGRRYDELVPLIERSGEVTRSRATLIARTEVAKAQATLTRARARYIGSTGYIWRTARDGVVRPAHRKLEGRVFSWDDPPVAEDNGTRHHPGEFPNCRPSCWAEPILPSVIE